jgi:IS605 OrfB family transposase
LQQNSGREQRFMRDTNHKISKALVKKAAQTRKALALEDLTGIRQRVTVRRAQRYERHSWAFYQLRQFLTYKAAWIGVCLVLVDPRNTSRTCSACGHCEKANRQSQASFTCQRCGMSMHADWNAAINISRAAVKPPMVATRLRAS